jgi:L-alanine-DL-glutamate epimerase-like enolase superfamily enzyme
MSTWSASPAGGHYMHEGFAFDAAEEPGITEVHVMEDKYSCRHEPDHIVSVQAWACTLPLRHPLDFGGFTISSRTYTAVRVTTARGLIADSIALSRNAPVDLCVLEVLAPHLVGKDGLAVTERINDLAAATRALEQDGLLGKARSLVEICMWDLLAQTAQMPLWRLLGGSARPLPVLLVEGYPQPRETDEAFAERLARRADESFSMFKLEAAGYDHGSGFTRRLEQVRDRLGADVGLVVDVLFRWQNAREAIKSAKSWEPFALDWLEDPLPRMRGEEYEKLRTGLDLPLASGDEATRLLDVTALIERGVLDVVRLDATTQGGISAALDLLARARTAGLRVSSHVSPEIHQHLAFASADMDHIEAFPLDDRFDRTHSLLQSSFMDRVIDGVALPTDEPGTGVHLNLEAVRSAAYRSGIVNKER